MTTTTSDVHGPIDFVLLEFPEERLRGEAAAALTDLVERDIVRIYDLLVIAKHADGSVELLELTDRGRTPAVSSTSPGLGQDCSGTRTCRRLLRPWSPARWRP
jgi:hypothetical protein